MVSGVLAGIARRSGLWFFMANKGGDASQGPEKRRGQDLAESRNRFQLHRRLGEIALEASSEIFQFIKEAAACADIKLA